MAADPSLTVVVVSYRCREMLRACLRSLADCAPATPLQVHVIDNASGDGTVDMIRREFPHVRLTSSDSNLGFAAATNMGLRESSSDFVLVLNPDTRVTEGTLDHLVALIASRPDVGIVGCRLELEDGTFDHAARRSFPTPLSALGHFTGVGRRRRAPARLAAYRAPRVEQGPVDAVNGAFMLIRKQALDEVGLFDEGYWMYMEDLDLCYRFAAAGWVTWYEPTVAVTHIKAGTSGKLRSLRLNYAFHYGMFRFYRKHYAPRSGGLANGAIYIGIAVKFLVSVVGTALRRLRAATIEPGRRRPPERTAA